MNNQSPSRYDALGVAIANVISRFERTGRTSAILIDELRKHSAVLSETTQTTGNGPINRAAEGGSIETSAAAHQPQHVDKNSAQNLLDYVRIDLTEAGGTRSMIECDKERLLGLLERLTAARSATPRTIPDVDWLANVIRAASGDHLNPLGAGALAEKIVDAMRRSDSGTAQRDISPNAVK